MSSIISTSNADAGISEVAKVKTDLKPHRRRFVGRKTGPSTCETRQTTSRSGAAARRRRIQRSGMNRRLLNQVPDDILQCEALNKAIAQLPSNYNFEIHKSVWKVMQASAQKVALQLPEGLLMYACVISDILEHFTGVETLIMGDVTYGACCVDDLSAKALGCDFLIHYGHSCLVPIDITDNSIKVLYVFVDISIDVKHLIASVKQNFPAHKNIAILGTIQFSSALHIAAKQLLPHFKSSGGSCYIPQCRPLSGGEVLGCTSPVLNQNCDLFVFVADGRFHLESAMIRNPTLAAFLYNPYSKTLEKHSYDTEKMKRIRGEAVQMARGAQRWGVILGTLGRQGSPAILRRVEKLLKASNREYFVLLLSEVFPAKLASFINVDAWVQIACPRLSIDWGHHFEKPLLSSYELETCLSHVSGAKWCPGGTYPMDFYSRSGGKWSNYAAKLDNGKVDRGMRS